MAEKFDNKFHKKYVGGQGEVEEKETIYPSTEYRVHTYEDILEEYRWYVGDPTAELPEEIVRQLEVSGKL